MKKIKNCKNENFLSQNMLLIMKRNEEQKGVWEISVSKQKVLPISATSPAT
jgi:hypothetical protein